jgi:hypothetical protein
LAFVISLGDSNRFAALSGDFNPLHTDPTAARRMIFGSTTPHGVHVALRALDHVVSTRASPVRLATLRCSFASPATHDQLLQVSARTKEGGALEIAVTQDGSTIQTIEANLIPTESLDDLPVDDNPLATSTARDLAFDEAEGWSGSVVLAADRALLGSLFPAIARLLPASQVAVLLATTKVVGMECPGLRSIFGDLKLEFERPAPSVTGLLTFRTVRAERRMSLIRLSLAGGASHGEITALFRPEPVAQATAEEAAAVVARGEFRGQRALVIGGSRGLGELTAKLLAMGGADVAITYTRGRVDAERVVRDICANGGKCDSFPFDVTSPLDRFPDDALVLKDWQPTHIYYFASGPIQSAKGREWSDQRFHRFCDFYVGGVARSLASLKRPSPSLDERPLTLFYPSTECNDKPQSGFGEYAAAKAAGEVICRTLAKIHPTLRISCPRLSPLKTDQTNTLRVGTAAADPLPVMLPLLRGLA